MSTPASFLSIPTELRNAIYFHIFTADDLQHESPHSSEGSPTPSDRQACPGNEDKCNPAHLAVLLTCRQIHSEAAALALSQTAFHLTGESPAPFCFSSRARPLPPAKLAAIRHITITSRISSLRAMNETWMGLPFGSAGLHLDSLTIVPIRADSSRSAYREVADLSQSHTLAYVFAETLKGLRNVGMVKVLNQSCFNEVVWRLLYRSMVYQIWRWGGGRCGVRFECSGDEVGGGEEWFRVWLKEGEEGCECGVEVVRLVGVTGEMPADIDLQDAV